MIRKIECVCVFTRDIKASVAFYARLGMREAWRIDRPAASLVGLKFPDATSAELVLSNNADVPVTEVELLCDDVRATRRELDPVGGITWIREPFATESGHVAVLEAPDGNVFVLVGG